VRTQWQFGPGDGNIPARALMGNPHDGDAWQPAGKSNRTLSRKLNSVRRHFFMTITSRAPSVGRGFGIFGVFQGGLAGRALLSLKGK